MRPGPTTPFFLRPHRAMALPLAALVLALVALPAWPQSPGEGLDLRETVAGVLAYTRWPEAPNPLRLCLAGDSPHADRLLRLGLPATGQPTVLLRRLDDLQQVPEQCDALYVGKLEPAQWRQLGDALAGQPVLTLCERATPCLAGGMVRLDIDPSGQPVRFEVNLDAVARGTVRIHPQVLRLGRRAAEPERKP